MGNGRGVNHTGASGGDTPSAGVLMMTICPGRATAAGGISVAARDAGNVDCLSVPPIGVVEPSCPGWVPEAGPGVARDGAAAPRGAGEFTVMSFEDGSMRAAVGTTAAS